MAASKNISELNNTLKRLALANRQRSRPMKAPPTPFRRFSLCLPNKTPFATNDVPHTEGILNHVSPTPVGKNYLMCPQIFNFEVRFLVFSVYFTIGNP